MHTWSSTRKVEARDCTIIQPCKYHFGKNIPEGYQYWTNCGNLLTLSGEINYSNEYEQLLASGIITPKQFVGVELDEKIYEGNRKAYPDLCLYHGDLAQSMAEAFEEGRFKPAFINLDLFYMPTLASQIFCKVLRLVVLSNVPQAVVVINMTLKNNSSGEWVDDSLFPKLVKENPSWIAYHHKWDGDKSCYHYLGSTTKDNDMCSYIFWNKAS